jgi:glycosyltransferase involved in cell wall biosynthesis
VSALPPGQPVVLFATADWYWPYWTNKQHMAVHLAARGFRVLYVESIGFRAPGLNAVDVARIARRLMAAAAPIRQVQENVWRLSPLTIPGASHHPLVARFNAWRLTRQIGGWLRGIGAVRPILWTYHPYMLALADALDARALVYHCVDDLAAVPGIDAAAVTQAERALLARCDCVFATSPALAERCAAIASERTFYAGNVADTALFARARADGPIPPDLAAIPRPRLAYVGVLSDFKTDFALLDTIAARRPDWHLVFIGEEREGQHDAVLARLLARANVHLIGRKPYAQLPDYLRGIDVALLPQARNDYTRSMFPMKYIEYLAAGRPVVATRLPALAAHAALHLTADDADGFIAAIAAALAEPRVLPLDHPVLLAQTWEARLDEMLRRIEARAAPAPGLIVSA